MKVLLDSDICIYIIKRKPADVLKRFQEFEPGEIAVSSITVAELMYAASKSQKPRQNQSAIEQFLTPLSVLPFDDTSAVIYGHVRANLERLGTPIGPFDTLIAAQALQQKVVLVTNNVREFARIPGLVVENWV